MNLKWILLVFAGFCRLMLAAAFTPEEARRVFGESSSTFTSSTMEVGDYVFMEIKWDVDADADNDDKEAKELSVVLHALREYITPEKVSCTNSPFCKALTTWLMPEPVFNVPEVERTVVKDEELPGARKAVYAFDAGPLKAAKYGAMETARSVNKRTDGDWLVSLKSAYENFKAPAEKRKFNVMLGCPIVDYILSSGKYIAEESNEDEKDGVAEVEKIVNWKPAKDSVFSEYPNMLWATHKNSESDLFYPQWNENDGGRFVEAEVLYRKGKDVPRILTLLAESICINPIGEKKWAYLGGVLKAQGKHEDALIAYIQALKFDKSDPWAWKGVRDCCQKLGYKVNATGLDWYFKLNDIK